MQSMVERTTSTGTPLGATERVDALTALRAYTVDSAWVAGEAHERGTLAPGMRADFVALAEDITAIPSDRIAATPVVATFVAGDCTHGEEALPSTS
jgi:predicted amidohydrolase YtcJ